MQTEKFAGTATAIAYVDGGVLGIYQNTTVCEKRGDVCILNDGGWKTVTTLRRMNQFAAEFCDRAFTVRQIKGDWHVFTREGSIPYETGMKVKL